MADHDARGIKSLLFEHGQLREPNGALRSMRSHRGTRAHRRARRGAKDALLLRRQPRLVTTDLTDDPWSHATTRRVRIREPLFKLGNDLVGKVVDAALINPCLGRVVGGAIPARAAHDVQPRRR